MKFGMTDNPVTFSERDREMAIAFGQKVLDNVKQEPRYIIEFIGYRIPDGALSACDTDSDGFNDNPPESAFWPFCTNDPSYFRVTALGYGGTVNTRVMLQSTVVVD